MQIHSVKLINYKSIGDYPESEIVVEPNITIIIGKNESGKTNILSGLSEISFAKPNSNAFSDDKVNRNSRTGTAIEYRIALKPSPQEQSMGMCTESSATISRDGCVLSGGIINFYQRECFEEFASLGNALDKLGANPFQIKQQGELQKYQRYREDLKELDRLDIYLRQASMDFLRAKLSKSCIEQKTELNSKLEAAEAKWFQLLSLFPVFFYRKTSTRLNAAYKLEEVQKELEKPDSAPNSLLISLVKLIDIPPKDFITAVRPGIEPIQTSIRGRIKQGLEDKLNKPFRDFYNTEQVGLDVDFNSGTVSFAVRSDKGALLSLSERSNGLRWYLELFIDVRSSNIAGKNIVYLLDEPGISLHVNAQKELLSLFRDLAAKGNQVVYSTHSPYMLDLEEGMHRIRAVVKSVDGFTKIYKTAYDARIAPDSQEDTLAPLIQALGMNLDSTFGPALNKVNIILEGMSDYIYLKTMSKLLSIDLSGCELIPSVGAANCINIASILHGWGCRYFVVFDYDNAGVQQGEEFMKKRMGCKYREQYCYLADASQDEINAKTYSEIEEKCEIEDVFIRSELDRFCEETSTSKEIGKPLKAKLVCNAIELGTFEANEKTKDNFRHLIERILSYVK